MKPNSNIKHRDEIVNSVLQIIDQEDQSISLEIRQKQQGVDKNFEITHKDVVASYIESGKNPIDIVKGYVIRNTRLDCGLYFGSISQTSEWTGVSRRTVINIFNNLQYDDLIRLFMDGVWAVHPKLLRKGNSGKYMGQLRFYHSLKKKKRPEKGEYNDEETAMIIKLKDIREGKKNDSGNDR